VSGNTTAFTAFPMPPAPVFVYASCPAGYTTLSGGVYVAKSDGSDAVGEGTVDSSIPASGGRWYVSGLSYPVTNPIRLQALEVCIR
jgi:hypothetical protein